MATLLLTACTGAGAADDQGSTSSGPSSSDDSNTATDHPGDTTNEAIKFPACAAINNQDWSTVYGDERPTAFLASTTGQCLASNEETRHYWIFNWSIPARDVSFTGEPVGYGDAAHYFSEPDLSTQSTTLRVRFGDEYAELILGTEDPVPVEQMSEALRDLLADVGYDSTSQ